MQLILGQCDRHEINVLNCTAHDRILYVLHDVISEPPFHLRKRLPYPPNVFLVLKASVSTPHCSLLPV